MSLGRISGNAPPTKFARPPKRTLEIITENIRPIVEEPKKIVESIILDDSRDEPFLVKTLGNVVYLALAYSCFATFFTQDGWTPNDSYDDVVRALLRFAIPYGIAFLCADFVHDKRGVGIALCACTATIVESDVPAWWQCCLTSIYAASFLKFVDFITVYGSEILQSRVQYQLKSVVQFFQDVLTITNLLVFALLASLLAVQTTEPVNQWLDDLFGNTVHYLADGWFPSLSLFYEPARVLFADSHIDLITKGTEYGSPAKYIFAMANPGPALGMLTAFFFFGPKPLRFSAFPAWILYAFGGVAPTYYIFAYVKPELLLALIGGSFIGNVITHSMDQGLDAPLTKYTLQNIAMHTSEQDAAGVSLAIVFSFLTSLLLAWLLLTMNCRSIVSKFRR